MTQLTLVRCFMVPTGTYHQQMRRAYSTNNLTGQAIALLGEETSRGTNLTSAAVARAVGGIIAPSAAPDSAIQIHNGWSTVRFRFLLEFQVQIPGVSKASFRKILSGYTDHADYARGRGNTVHIDPYSLMVVDSHITLRDTQQGGYIVSEVVSNDLLLVGDHSPSYNNSNEYSLRPTDVLGSVSTAGTVLNFQSEHEPVVVDTRMQFGGGVKYSRRSNNIPSQYLSRLMTGYREACVMANDQTDMVGLGDMASAYVRENAVSADQLFYTLSQDTEFFRSGYFTYGQLSSIFPDLDAKTTIGEPPRAQQVLGVANTMGSEHWHGSNLETVIANIISTGVPAIMVECKFAFYAFTITNMNPQRIVDVYANQEPGMMVAGLDAGPFMDQFRVNIINHLIPMVDPNNMIDYCISVICDVYDNINISISIENAPPVVFNAPLFASSKLSPIITGDAGRVSQLTEDISTVLSIVESASPQQPQIITSVSQWSQPTVNTTNHQTPGVLHGHSRFL